MGIAKEVCRIEKIKSISAMAGAYQHNLRLKEIPNADERKTNYNIELTDRPTGKSYMECFNEMIGHSLWYKDGTHKIAKNAIYAVEFMLTFGGEARNSIDINTWSSDNIMWLKTNFGENNLISAILHVDECTPHIHAVIVPLDEKGKLNYTKYLGGSKYRLSELQDSYHEEVGKRHHLDRGLKGSKAQHQDIDNFYSMVNETVSIIKLPEPEQNEGFFKKGESAKQYQERITPLVLHSQSVAIAKEKENELLKKRIATIEHLQNGVIPIDEYNLIKDNLFEAKQQLAQEQRDKQFYHNWALEEQTKRESLERTIPQKVANAVKNTTETLQNLYESVKEKYSSLKRKFEKLSQKYDLLEKEFQNIKEQHEISKKKSVRMKELEQDSELMYAIMDNRGISNIYNRYKKEQHDGYRMSGFLEIAKYRSRQQGNSDKRKIHRVQQR